MKNFPHQINQLPRLNEAVAVFARLIDEGRNIDDDGIVGDALARAGVYTFRNASRKSVETLLASEHRKPRGSQGTRTCARDLRRFFRLLGFITRRDDSAWDAEARERELVARAGLAAHVVIHRAVRRARLVTKLGGEPEWISRPLRIMRRYASDGLPRSSP